MLLNLYMMYMHSGGVHFVQPGLGVDSAQGGVQVQTAQGGGGGEVQGGVLPPVLDAGGGDGPAFHQQEQEGAGRNRDILDWFNISSRVHVHDEIPTVRLNPSNDGIGEAHGGGVSARVEVSADFTKSKSCIFARQTLFISGILRKNDSL